MRKESLAQMVDYLMDGVPTNEGKAKLFSDIYLAVSRNPFVYRCNRFDDDKVILNKISDWTSRTRFATWLNNRIYFLCCAAKVIMSYHLYESNEYVKTFVCRNALREHMDSIISRRGVQIFDVEMSIMGSPHRVKAFSNLSHEL